MYFYSETSDKGHSDKGHNRNNLRTKDKFQCTKWIIITSDKGQPLDKGQNGQKTMGPKRVRWVHCIWEMNIFQFSFYRERVVPLAVCMLYS